ncbi:MAG: UvrD-helicase domain-containing protein, partial [Planctomycetes bacterium]|nr:UvrD-helicase domain-containing protein [Planctomycetota bacterium]
MDPFSFTHAQRRAIESTGCSVIVSAAAGSGKTAVLAERCAYLICDAPPEARCDVDQLLVLTFTEAAASEMRSRIVAAIRLRASRRPQDRRLSRQIALVDAAHISTVHSFCLWLVRRWFSELGIDPSAAMLDEKEAVLMKRDVLDTLFNELYPGPAPASDRLGRIDGDSGHEAGDSPGARFVRLINDYGLGEDRAISTFVLKLHEFTSSLPDPDAWLRDAVESLADRPEDVVQALAAGLGAELDGQVEHCSQVADTLKADDAVGWFFADQIQSYVEQLVTWRQTLNGELSQYEAVCESIRSFVFSNKRGPRLAKDADPNIKKAREAAKDRLSEVRKQWFGERIKKRYALFSHDEWIDGLRKTAPYVGALVERVTAFREAYLARKSRLGVLDFSDLERFALRLLQSTDEPAGPSAIAYTLHRRFAHLLVDEFQDINPVQEAILRLASHESDPDRPGNLFVVGDVKQSIYRFRLAEPRVFTERLARFAERPPKDAKPSRSSPRLARTDADDRTTGVAIHLQENFRSQPVILDAINLIFGRLMRGS